MGNLKVRNYDELMENKGFLNFLEETGCTLNINSVINTDGDVFCLPDGNEVIIDIEQSNLSYMANCVEEYERWKKKQGE